MTAAECKIFNDATGQWVDSTADLSTSIELPFEGMTLRVCPREKLAAYKKLLNGEHQKQDVAEISF